MRIFKLPPPCGKIENGKQAANPPLHAHAAVSHCRGAFYMRPDRTAGTTRQQSTRPCPGGHTGRPYGARSTWSVGRGAHTPPNQAAGTNKPASNATRRQSFCRGGLYARPDRTAGTTRLAVNAALSGRPYRPPLRRMFDPFRRAGCPHPAKPGRRNYQASGQRDPVVAACGHAALRGSAGIGGAFGRIYNPPLQARLLPFPVVGAAISRPRGPAVCYRTCFVLYQIFSSPATNVPGRGSSGMTAGIWS